MLQMTLHCVLNGTVSFSGKEKGGITVTSVDRKGKLLTPLFGIFFFATSLYITVNLPRDIYSNQALKVGSLL